MGWFLHKLYMLHKRGSRTGWKVGRQSIPTFTKLATAITGWLAAVWGLQSTVTEDPVWSCSNNFLINYIIMQEEKEGLK